MLTDDNLTKIRKHAKLRAFYLCKSAWLDIMYTDRTFFDKVIDEVAINQIRALLDEPDTC
jgi:hypothetical protein